MPLQAGLTTENEIAEAVLRILSSNGRGWAHYPELIAEIPKIIELSPQDLKMSNTRQNEQLWEQRVRNIRSHKENEGNYIYKGYLVEIEGGLAITELGIKYISQK